MNIAVVLTYFTYFTYFEKYDKENQYFYISNRKKFLSSGVNSIRLFDESLVTNINTPNPNIAQYFPAIDKINTIKSNINISSLANAYEAWLSKMLNECQINLLISGGVTGFERCALSIARTMGISTLCVWEGFFRPNTISYDVQGMNAESAFAKLSFESHLQHIPTQSAITYLEEYTNQIKQTSQNKKSLRELQGNKFNPFLQMRNRISELKDIERIRLPIFQHIESRLHYYRYRKQYYNLSDINTPFLFFPLQTHTDSNVLINADLYPFEQYVERVCTAFSMMHKSSSLMLLIKEHPLDVFRKHYKKNYGSNIHWLSPSISTTDLLNHPLCCGTIVVNSTAGFESLLAGIPVLVLGRAIYGYPELVLFTKNNSVEEIAMGLDKLLGRKVNMEYARRFSYSLFDRMTCVGNLENAPPLQEVSEWLTIFAQVFPSKENKC